MIWKFTFYYYLPHSSVRSVQKVAGSTPGSAYTFFRGSTIVNATGFIPLSPLTHCFDDGYVGKKPVAWEEYCADYWLKEF